MSVANLLLISVAATALKVQEKKQAPELAKDAAIGDAALPFDQAHGKAVFYAVVMGSYTRRHQVSLWLSSLRIGKMGNWGGEAVIVTDKPKCLEKTLEEAGLIGTKISSDKHVDIFAPPEGMKGNLHVMKRPTVTSVLRMKLEKARAWINIGNAAIPGKVGMIVYTDEDVVIGKDVNNFVQQAKTFIPLKHTLALFRDIGKSAGELHTGIVVMYNNPHTVQCLREWGLRLTKIDIYEGQENTRNAVGGPLAALKNKTWEEKLSGGDKLADMDEFEREASLTDESNMTLTKTDESEASNTDESEADTELQDLQGPDQQALGRTKPCMAAADHKGIKILDAQYFWFPTPGGMAKAHTSEFIHFTNTARSITGRGEKTGKAPGLSASNIAKYLRNIGVPENIDPQSNSHSQECLI